MNLSDEVKKLEALLESGSLTREEFTKRKVQLIMEDVRARFPPKKRCFNGIAALFAADREATLDTETFAWELWPLLCAHISSPQDAAALPKPVMNYYASALLEGDVGNGGFAQAAYNYPAWFPAAADGYAALGLPGSASIIRDAIRWLPSERKEQSKKGLFRATIGQVFAHFAESRMSLFNDRIVDSEWYVAERRVAYARENAEAFCSLG